MTGAEPLLVVGPGGLSVGRVTFAGDPAVTRNAITFLTQNVTQAAAGSIVPDRRYGVSNCSTS